MIESTDKPTKWSSSEVAGATYRRASVWPNIMCSVTRGTLSRPPRWLVSFGLPGVCVHDEEGYAPTLEAAQAAADAVAERLIRETIARMHEALNMLGSPRDGSTSTP